MNFNIHSKFISIWSYTRGGILRILQFSARVYGWFLNCSVLKGWGGRQTQGPARNGGVVPINQKSSVPWASEIRDQNSEIRKLRNRKNSLSHSNTPLRAAVGTVADWCPVLAAFQAASGIDLAEQFWQLSQAIIGAQFWQLSKAASGINLAATWRNSLGERS